MNMMKQIFIRLFYEYKMKMIDNSIRENILSIPQDHKNLIYQFLDVKELVQLGKTCKSFHQDAKRKYFIAIKLVDSCFYHRSPELNDNNFYSHLDIPNIYFQRLKTINISDITIYGGDKNPCLIHFFVFPFMMLEYKEKYLIVENLVKYLYELWKYAEDKNEFIRNYSFQLFELYHSIENVLKNIFIYDDEMRTKILDDLGVLKRKTKNSKNITHGNFIYIFIETNKYSRSYFISSLDMKDYWRNLVQIIKIADFLENYNIKYLYDYLYEIFRPFIDCLYSESILDDVYIEEFDRRLKENYTKTKTYKERLFELFTSCNYNIHRDFTYAFELRMRRWYGLEMDEDDYDY